MWTILLSLSQVANSEPIEIVDGLTCYQVIAEEWKTTPNKRVFYTPSPLKFHGKSDISIIVLNNDGYIQSVVLFIDGDAKDGKYPHSRRIYKVLTRKYGQPFTTEFSWRWITPTAIEIHLGMSDPSMALLFNCP